MATVGHSSKICGSVSNSGSRYGSNKVRGKQCERRGATKDYNLQLTGKSKERPGLNMTQSRRVKETKEVNESPGSNGKIRESPRSRRPHSQEVQGGNISSNGPTVEAQKEPKLCAAIRKKSTFKQVDGSRATTERPKRGAQVKEVPNHRKGSNILVACRSPVGSTMVNIKPIPGTELCKVLKHELAVTSRKPVGPILITRDSEPLIRPLRGQQNKSKEFNKVLKQDSGSNETASSLDPGTNVLPNSGTGSIRAGKASAQISAKSTGGKGKVCSRRRVGSKGQLRQCLKSPYDVVCESCDDLSSANNQSDLNQHIPKLQMLLKVSPFAKRTGANATPPETSCPTCGIVSVEHYCGAMLEN